MEDKILSHLIQSDIYFSKVFPYLKADYFSSVDSVDIFKIIDWYNDKYSMSPGVKEMKILVDKAQKAKDDKGLISTISKYFKNISNTPIVDNIEFVIDESEAFIKKSDLKNSMISAIDILSKEEDFTDKSGSKIQELINDSLSIHFDNSVGLDLDDVDKRLEYYKKQEESGFLTSLPSLNRITKGGFKRRTLSIFAAPPGVGKTLMMANHACDFVLNGHNVLYVSLEMSELDIGKRIDSNIYNIKYNDLENVDETYFKNTVQELKSSGIGNMVIKEYPTGAAGPNMIKSLLKDLEQKKQFKPDIIIVDYIGIMSESAQDMYTNIKRNAEGLRAIAVENDCHVMSAVQTNRGGIDKTEMGFSDLAESTGPAQIADFLCFIVKIDFSDDTNHNSEIKTKQNILLQIRKNRYGGLPSSNILVQQDFGYFRITEVGSTDANTPEPERLDRDEILESLKGTSEKSLNSSNSPFTF